MIPEDFYVSLMYQPLTNIDTFLPFEIASDHDTTILFRVVFIGFR